MYTNYGTVSSGTTTGNGNGSVIATGKVLVNATNLNVRTGAGTENGIIGTLLEAQEQATLADTLERLKQQDS